MHGDGTGAKVNDWVNVVRRARLDRTTKFVALMMASYASKDGSEVFPGVARLCVQCGIRYSTARLALSALRAAGLIQLVRRGAARAGRSDEYRLILAEDLLDRVEVPTPEQERDAIEEVNRTNRSRQKAWRDKPASASDAGPSALSQSGAETAISAKNGHRSALSRDRPPTIETSPVSYPPLTDDLRTAVTARAREDGERHAGVGRSGGRGDG